MPLVAVISPAKTLDMGKTDCKLHSQPQMAKQTTALLPSAKKLTSADMKKLMGVSDAIAKLNVERYKSFEKQASKQAALAFDGPAFRGLAAGDFDSKDQAIAQQSVRILSGLYGLLRPYDDIRPYRLEMGVSVPNPKGKTLYDFWGDSITEAVGKEFKKGGGPKLLVNCASQEYWKAVRPQKLPEGVKVITCDFPGPAVFAKKARGMMCRHIVKHRVKDVEGLKKFKGEGADSYCFSAAKSSDSKLVFIRGSGAAGKRAADEVKGGSAKKARKA